MAKGPKIAFISLEFQNLFLLSPDYDDPRAEAAEVVRPTRLPVKHRDGLRQPQNILALLLHLKVKAVIFISLHCHPPPALRGRRAPSGGDPQCP